MNYAIVNLGCKVNRVESDSFAVSLQAQGWEAAREADADLIVVNTCTVTGEAEKKTRKAVRRALRENGQATVMVTGCAVAIDASTYEAMSERVRVVGKTELLEAVRREFRGGGGSDRAGDDAEYALECISRVSESDGFGPTGESSSLDAIPLPVGEGFRTRVGVKVQDGCDNACTYCIVHVARGRASSRSADDVVSECMQLARAGVREIVLTGINLGSYCDGNRRDPRVVRLPALLERLLEETVDLRAADEPPCRFRISSIEPRDVDDALIELLSVARGRICRHLHLPMQSGSTKVLREMARPYTAERFIELVESLRRRVPGIALSTDIIVGFPGETEDDFRQTLETVRRCAFEKIHVFPYSRREGTPAAARVDQVPPSAKTARAAELRTLGDELRAEGLTRRSGTIEIALVEESGIAMAESYYEVEAPAGASAGEMVEISL